jgi:hypothetical protein
MASHQQVPTKDRSYRPPAEEATTTRGLTPCKRGGQLRKVPRMANVSGVLPKSIVVVESLQVLYGFS